MDSEQALPADSREGLLARCPGPPGMREAHLQGHPWGLHPSREGWQPGGGPGRAVAARRVSAGAVGAPPEPWQRAAVGARWGHVELGEVWGRGGGAGAGGRAAAALRLAGPGAGLCCPDGRVIKNNKRKETWIRYSLSTLIVLWGPNRNGVLLEGSQKRNQASRSVQS